MPRGDRTGPWGMGPMTGRRMGFCAGFSVPGFANPAGWWFGRGWGRGFGRGWGRCWGFPFGAFWPPLAYAAGLPKEVLKGYVSFLENMLENLKKSLGEKERSKEEGQ